MSVKNKKNRHFYSESLQKLFVGLSTPTSFTCSVVNFATITFLGIRLLLNNNMLLRFVMSCYVLCFNIVAVGSAGT